MSSLGLLFLLIAFSSASLQLVLFNSSFTESMGAFCLDGSPAGYYYQLANDPSGANQWVFYLEGGGLCVEPIDCYSRMKTHLGSSTKFPKTKNLPYGVLSENATVNPFSHFNHIFVPYCSGDTHTGNLKGKTDLGFHFAGHIILDSILQQLRSTTNLNTATHVLLSGGSAGGIGTFNNANWFKDQFPNAVVKAMPEAGYFFAPNIVLYEEWILGIGLPYGKFAAEYLATFLHSRLDPVCVAAYPDNPKWCWLAGLLYPHIKTEMLIANNIFDGSQLQFVGWVNDGSAWSKGYQAWFGDDVVFSIQNLTSVPDKAKDGYYLPGCYDHTGNLCMASRTRVQGYGLNDIAGDWFFEKNKLPHRLVDGCWKQGGLPCNPVCPSFCG